MSTPESKVKAKVSALLKKYTGDIYYEMPVPTGFGKSGLDYTCCLAGKFFVIETKAGKAGPTPRQKAVMDSVVRAGGRAFLVNEVSGLDDLEIWLKWIMEGR